MDSNTPKPAKHKKLTYKETMLVKAKTKGLTNGNAYLDAGYSANTERVAEANARRVLARPHVKDALNISLAKHNINIDSSIAPIGKALHAMKMNEFTGEITEDLGMQLKASDRALKLMGIGQDKDGPSVHFHAHIEAQKDKYGL